MDSTCIPWPSHHHFNLRISEFPFCSVSYLSKIVFGPTAEPCLQPPESLTSQVSPCSHFAGFFLSSLTTHLLGDSSRAPPHRPPLLSLPICSNRPLELLLTDTVAAVGPIVPCLIYNDHRPHRSLGGRREGCQEMPLNPEPGRRPLGRGGRMCWDLLWSLHSLPCLCYKGLVIPPLGNLICFRFPP